MLESCLFVGFFKFDGVIGIFSLSTISFPFRIFHVPVLDYDPLNDISVLTEFSIQRVENSFMEICLCLILGIDFSVVELFKSFAEYEFCPYVFFLYYVEITIIVISDEIPLIHSE